MYIQWNIIQPRKKEGKSCVRPMTTWTYCGMVSEIKYCVSLTCGLYKRRTHRHSRMALIRGLKSEKQG